MRAVQPDGLRGPASLFSSAVGPSRVLCAVQVEFKHFAASDTVVSLKVREQVINRNGPAADGEAFARFIPPECDWAFECLVHKLTPEPIGYYTYRLMRDGHVVSTTSKSPHQGPYERHVG
jgi:hypothetical protein